MAIRFVDKDPEETPKAPKREARTERPAPPEAEAAPPEGDLLPGLTHPKPERKARGRKPAQPAPAAPTAFAAAAVVTPADDQPGEALLPGLQIHAKPTPKPRGRKKAFG